MNTTIALATVLIVFAIYDIGGRDVPWKIGIAMTGALAIALIRDILSERVRVAKK